MNNVSIIQQEDAENVKIIAPSQVPALSRDEVLLVNRVRINSHLIELELRNSADEDIIMIMRRAIKDMKIKEKETKRISMGVEMTVRDVLKVFKMEDIDKMPLNTFALAKL